MKNILNRIPDPILRLVIVFTALVTVVILVKSIVIPDEYKNPDIFLTAAVDRETAKEMKYAGSQICGECHEDETEIKAGGFHQKLSCEVCHGAAITHIEEPDETQPPIPAGRKFCPLCHTYNPSRPTGFPQINPVAHNPLEPCVKCHNPHNPEPTEIPRECAACHAEIYRTKAVSPHILLSCTECHEAPELHKSSPWLSKPTKPETRDFCGKCHGGDSLRKDTPKVDITEHGGKYMCWQCHYPHMPEMR